jgi:hypothetical protein
MHTTDPHGAGHAPAPNAGHELSDAKIRPLAESGVLLVVLCLISFWSMIYVHHWLQDFELEKAPLGNALTPAREIPPGPLLEQAPHMPVNWAETRQLETDFFKKSGLADARGVELARLHGYGWVDEQAKLVHIPIQQAMQKLIERGVPTRK